MPLLTPLLPSPIHSQLNYGNKQMLLGAMVIAGYDRAKGGQVFACPIGGTLLPDKWAIDGSGSTFIWGYCDAEYRCGSQTAARLTLHSPTLLPF